MCVCISRLVGCLFGWSDANTYSVVTLVPLGALQEVRGHQDEAEFDMSIVINLSLLPSFETNVWSCIYFHKRLVL